MKGEPNLTILSVNINSFNMSTLGGENNKTYLKIEGITGKKSDIIFIVDTRMGKKVKEIEKMMQLNKNGKYKLYSNSTKESRGVAIAIKSSIFHEVYETVKDINENFLILKVKILGKKLALGVIYGPNRNDTGFFREIYAALENVEEEIILGGDFNTILDNRNGVVNIDNQGGGVIPNIENSREINKWFNEWRVADPFRVRYLDVSEYSYMSFRRNDEFGKSRLDFFLMDKTILGWVKNVWYEDRLGRDFDH